RSGCRETFLPGCPYRCEGAGLLVLEGLRSHQRRATVESHRRAVLRVIEAMRQDLSAPLDLAAMAGTAFMSRFHFVRVFQDVTTVSPARFLAALRMERAKRLLLETSLPVTTICYEVGYGSLGTFTRLFTDVVGVNPSWFRRLHAQLAGGGLETLVADYLQRRRQPGPGPSRAGLVHVPHDFHGLVFIGLFASSVPQRRPSAGTLLVIQAVHQFHEGSGVTPCGHVHEEPFELALDPRKQAMRARPTHATD